MPTEDKSMRTKKLIVIFLGAIMIFSVFGVVFYGFSSQDQKVKYNKHTFYRTNNGWLTTLNKEKLYFSYVPQDLADLEISNEAASLLNNNLEIDTTYETNSSLNQTIGLIQYNLALRSNQKNIFIRNGAINNNSFNLPVITCKDATSKVPVILFKKGNRTNINIEDSCITAEAPSHFELLRVADRISFQILGIMK